MLRHIGTAPHCGATLGIGSHASNATHTGFRRVSTSLEQLGLAGHRVLGGGRALQAGVAQGTAEVAHVRLLAVSGEGVVVLPQLGDVEAAAVGNVARDVIAVAAHLGPAEVLLGGGGGEDGVVVVGIDVDGGVDDEHERGRYGTQ